MPMPSKIVGAVALKVKDMLLNGFNCSQIGKEVGVSKDTIKSWAEKNGISFSKGKESAIGEKEEEFVLLLKSGQPITAARKACGLSYESSKKIVNKLGLEFYDRSRADAALDKTLTIEEANSRLPKGAGKVIGYDQGLGKYIVEAPDGFRYFKTSAKLGQGDPRGKSGTVKTVEEVAQALVEIGYELDQSTFTRIRDSMTAKHLVCGSFRKTKFKLFFTAECRVCKSSI